MKVPPLSEQPGAEEEEQDFPVPPSYRKKRSLAVRRTALRPRAVGIGLTVLVVVVAVGAYALGASIDSWNDHPGTATAPTVHPTPVPSVSSEAAMSGDYETDPDGVLVCLAQFVASIYTRPELPEEAKENAERGAETATEHHLALLIYSWNIDNTQPLADMSDPSSNFAEDHIVNTQEMYTNG